MAGFVVAAGLVAASMEVVVENVVEAVDQGVHRGDEIGSHPGDAGQLLGEIVAADRPRAGDLLDRLAPPLEPDLAQHGLLGVQGALQLLVQQVERHEPLPRRRVGA